MKKKIYSIDFDDDEFFICLLKTYPLQIHHLIYILNKNLDINLKQKEFHEINFDDEIYSFFYYEGLLIDENIEIFQNKSLEKQININKYYNYTNYLFEFLPSFNFILPKKNEFNFIIKKKSPDFNNFCVILQQINLLINHKQISSSNLKNKKNLILNSKDY